MRPKGDAAVRIIGLVAAASVGPVCAAEIMMCAVTVVEANVGDLSDPRRLDKPWNGTDSHGGFRRRRRAVQLRHGLMCVFCLFFVGINPQNSILS